MHRQWTSNSEAPTFHMQIQPRVHQDPARQALPAAIAAATEGNRISMPEFHVRIALGGAHW
jgi:hypothetical protein